MNKPQPSQSNARYAKANVLVCDPQHNIRHQTHAALRDIGFHAVTDVADLEKAKIALGSSRFDLAIFAMDSADDGTAALIRQIRQHRHNHDPFLPVIVSVWQARQDLIDAATNAGADDLIRKPFSTQTLAKRISMLVHARKPFVATSDYVGPDRRRRAEACDDAGTVEVPNTLSEKALGRHKTGESRQAVGKALAQLQRTKVRNIARRIAWLAETAQSCVEQTDAAVHWTQIMADIADETSAYRRALHASYPESFGTLCDAVAQTANVLQAQRPDMRGAVLLEKSALALKMASDITDNEADVADAISDVLNKASNTLGNAAASG